MPGATKVAPVVVESLLYLVTPDAIVALRVEDGAEAWRSSHAAALAAAVTADGGWLILPDDNGTLTALRTSTARFGYANSARW